jgi:hypothetical protein
MGEQKTPVPSRTEEGFKYRNWGELELDELDAFIRKMCGMKEPENSQHALLKKAKKAYLVPLNHPRYANDTLRYSVYCDLGDKSGLHVLWPCDEEELLNYQVSCKTQREDCPRYHFAMGGCGYSKPVWLAMALNRINPFLKVQSLEGYEPSDRNNGPCGEKGYRT